MGKLTWHDGALPESEIWLKLSGDKEGGSFKMIFEIVNVSNPNSVQNTCMFCCFEASDSITNSARCSESIAIYTYYDWLRGSS